MITRTEKEKMLAGDLYDAGAPELQADAAVAHEWLARYNAACGKPISERRELLLERLAAVGEGAVIRPPFHCDYGFNISLGAGVFLNFNCVILDVVEVTIGDKTQIGPGVQILTGRSPARCCWEGLRVGVWSPNPHRAQRLDRGRRDHSAGRDDR